MKFETNYDVDFSKRTPASGADDLFHRRWSPRSYKKVDIPQEILASIFDAARWSPSCFNEQPWLFVTSSGEEDFDLFLNLLVEMNQQWAKNASLLGFIFARRNFSHDNSPDLWAPFDCGAAWMALTRQANMHGLYTHGMGGINKAATYEALNVSADEYEVICGFALGVIDRPEELPEEFATREFPSPRKELSEIWQQGPFVKVK